MRLSESDIRAIEGAALRAWPARGTEKIGGWLMRFTVGHSHRGNSVLAHGDPGSSLDAAIGAVEGAYRARGLPPQFQLTPLSVPPGLAEALAARGYVSTAPTHVQVARITEVIERSGGDSGVVHEPPAKPDVEDLVRSGSRSLEDAAERLEIVHRIVLPHTLAVLRADDETVACGMGVRDGDWTGVFIMRTRPEHRRKGYAARTLASIAAWGRAQGASRIFLQVEDDNAPARALYARAGFEDAYPYRFMRGKS